MDCNSAIQKREGRKMTQEDKDKLKNWKSKFFSKQEEIEDVIKWIKEYWQFEIPFEEEIDEDIVRSGFNKMNHSEVSEINAIIYLRDCKFEDMRDEEE